MKQEFTSYEAPTVTLLRLCGENLLSGSDEKDDGVVSLPIVPF